MSNKTEIAWTDATWNPVRGCSRVSAGCAHCYAERFAERWRGVPGHPFEQGFDVRLVPEALELPLHWRKPRRIFVNSMSDLFHHDVPTDFIDRVFAVMALAHWHTFQVLTKRPEAMRSYLSHTTGRDNVLSRVLRAAQEIEKPRGYPHLEAFGWPYRNVHLGVSVENRRERHRIAALEATPAAVRLLSCEPLLEDLGDLELAGSGISWVIAGGESGPGARPCDVAWIRSLVEQCRAAGVPAFVKQLGACASDPVNGLAGYSLHVPEEAAPLIAKRLRDRKGADPAEWPEDLRVREFPVTP